MNRACVPRNYATSMTRPTGIARGARRLFRLTLLGLAHTALLAVGCNPSSENGTGGSTSASSSSGGAACATDTECPPTANECAAPACVEGSCTLTFAPVGYLAGVQTSGDCLAEVCDGAGHVITVFDDSDVPNDNNPCTTDFCLNGAASNMPLPAGAPCGAQGLFCDGAGSCEGCTADSDCGVSDVCVTHTCDVTTGDCSIAYTQGDPAQIQGDCKKVFCNGNGAPVSTEDDADLLADGNPCTIDGCSMGLPFYVPASAGTPCNGGHLCDGAGSCVACQSDAECGIDNACATYHCQNGACSADYVPLGAGDPGGQVAGDCKTYVCDGSGGVTSVPDDADLIDDANPCTIDACAGGVLSHTPTPGAGCGPTMVCNGSSCMPGCMIAGVYTPIGELNPFNGCETCVGGAGGSEWAIAPQGEPCINVQAFNTHGVCKNGACYYGCYDGGQFWPALVGLPGTTICQTCIPSQSTKLYTGGCHLGMIQGGCSLGVCYLLYDTCDCADCAIGCGGTCYGAPKNVGTPCADDNNACTNDVCGGFGNCTHYAVPDGTSCGPGMTCGAGMCM